MKHLLQSALLAACIGAMLLPAAAQHHTYDVLTADVPFRFSVGHRTFRPGHYQFIFVGAGLLALRDSRGHIVARIVARPVESPVAPATSKLVFRHRNKHSRLAQIWIENRTQVLEIVGEDLALVQSPPHSTPSVPIDPFSLNERRDAPRLRRD